MTSPPSRRSGMSLCYVLMNTRPAAGHFRGILCNATALFTALNAFEASISRTASVLSRPYRLDKACIPTSHAEGTPAQSRSFRRNYWSVGDTHFSPKNCISAAGRVCVYSSLILSMFFSSFFSSNSCIFIAKPSSIVVFVVQTKWTFNHEGRGHRSLIGVSRGIGRPHRDTLRFSEYKIPYARC